QPNEAMLCWTASEAGDFERYELKRGATSPVTLDSETIATAADPADTCFVDTGLPPYDVFYYKVFVYEDGLGVYSVGSNEVERPAFEPLVLSYPFFDDMESGGGNFLVEQPWAVTDEVAHSGLYSWSDSPEGSYEPDAGVSMVFRVDLSGGWAVMPELTFWHQRRFEENADWGMLDVSTNGGVTYRPIYYITGMVDEWRQARVDLTPYRSEELWLRFRILTNGDADVADGWHIDDIRIDETTTGPVAYPFLDSFNDSLFTHASWIPGGYGWTALSDDGTHYWSTYSTGSTPFIYASYTAMVLGNTLDLSAASHPQVRLRYRSLNNNGSATHLEISEDGVTYTTLYTFPSQSNWTTLQVDLSDYAYVGSPPVRLRLRYYCGYPYGGGWFDVEALVLAEDPALTPQVDDCRLDVPTELWSTLGEASAPIYARVYEPGVTPGPGPGPGIQAEIGLGPDGTHPQDQSAGWSWIPASYAGDAGNEDIYSATLVADSLGTYDYAYRFSMDGGTYWLYADLDGNDLGAGGYNFYEIAQAGHLVVTQRPELSLTASEVELTVPSGATESSRITVGNEEGAGPLAVVILESLGPPVYEDVPWLSVIPDEFIVDPDETQNMTVMIDATDLAADSTYAAHVILVTNDPDNTEVDLPVTVHVIAPGDPNLSGTVQNVRHLPAREAVILEVYDGGTLQATATAGADGRYKFYGLDAGSYRLRAYSQGYYPVELDVDLPASDVDITLHVVPEILLTDTNVAYWGEASQFDGEPLQAGDVVTVQDAQGIFCGSYHVTTAGHYGFLHVYGDDPTTPEIDEGASSGDSLTFRVNGELATPTPPYPTWPQNGAVVQVELEAATTSSTTLLLDEGWNLISFSRTPEPWDSLEVILAELLVDSTLIVASTFDQEWGGALTYDPAHPEQSDLWAMDEKHGYWLKVTEAESLTVVGARYWADNLLRLEEGWNLTSYLPREPRDVARALASIEGAYAVVHGFDEGALTYVPEDTLHSTLEWMDPDLGYWVRMLMPGTLAYDEVPEWGPFSAPPSDPEGDISGMPVELSLTTTTEFTPTHLWDSYYGTAKVDSLAMEIGEVIEVYDPQGVLCGQFEIRSEGQYGFVAVYGDDPYTAEEDEGAEVGDRITFRWWVTPEVEVPGYLSWTGKRGLKEFDLLFSTDSHGPDGEELRYALWPARPSPFRGETVIRYTLPERVGVELVVYGLEGQVIKTLVNGVETTGLKTAMWDGRDGAGQSVASGIYYYKLRAGDYRRGGRVVLIR
ncbi:carboxypeptidase regulatory-like domain-containing protein, partial [Candidatus Eisenbacteria bacterium]